MRIRYYEGMKNQSYTTTRSENLLTPQGVKITHSRRLEAMRMQEIESNPLDAKDITMFEMFEYERWSHERCRTYILEQVDHCTPSQDTSKPTRHDPYVDPDTQILINTFGIHDAAELERIERRISTQRIREGMPQGTYDLSHLRSIHKQLFQDIYPWAGEIRTVDIHKGGSQFQLYQYIETGMSHVHGRLVSLRYLRGLNKQDFAREAGVIIGDVNYVHPFREGNGRTQLQYLKLLCQHAGHHIDLTCLNPSEWIEASIRTHSADYTLMSQAIELAITGTYKA